MSTNEDRRLTGEPSVRKSMEGFAGEDFKRIEFLNSGSSACSLANEE